jgi:hypothetical protein
MLANLYIIKDARACKKKLYNTSKMRTDKCEGCL